MKFAWPLCTFEYVDAIHSTVDASGVEWTTGGRANTALFPRVEILRKYGPPSVSGDASRSRDDGIHAHEFTHVRQFWMAFGMALAAGCAVFGALVYGAGLPADWGLAGALPLWLLAPIAHALFKCSSGSYRLNIELDAYREQRAHADGRGGYLSEADTALCLMAPKYALGLTYDEALRAVREHARG